jgi:hypothetical protein
MDPVFKDHCFGDFAAENVGTKLDMPGIETFAGISVGCGFHTTGFAQNLGQTTSYLWKVVGLCIVLWASGGEILV